MMKSTWLIASALMFGLGGMAAAEEKAEPPKASAPVSDAAAEVKAGTGVEKRAIVGEAATFTAGTTVWVWSSVTNATPSIKHVWKRDGKVAWTATLNVGGKKWSTQSRRTIPKAGSWEVEVQSADGASRGTVAFSVQ
ncbi:MAG: DUF2914 domain-containing protein [Kofleriaceae bacterium]|nr:DUF2914 domain-containing protein [Kofleriaceae bacterium]